jgi:hypothetical protein
MTTGHARIGGSSKHLWSCAGALEACESKPPRAVGEAAQIGTQLHGVFEDALTGKDWQAHLASLTGVPESYAAHMHTAVAQAQAALASWGAAETHCELRVPIALGLGVPEAEGDCWGTADTLTYDPQTRTAGVLDLKTGQEPVSADSAQLALYAAGWVRLLEGELKPVDRIRVGIVQFGRAFDERTFTRAEMDAQWASLGAVLRSMREPGAARTAGEHCRYCPAQGDCRPYAEWLLPPELTSRAADVLTTDELATALVRTKAMTAWAAEVKNELARRVTTGGESLPPTVKWVKGIQRRTWSDEASVIAVAQLAGLIDVVAPRRARSPAKVLELLPANASAFAPLIVRPTVPPSLVPSSDRRQAVDPSGFDLEALTQAVEFDE